MLECNIGHFDNEIDVASLRQYKYHLRYELANIRRAFATEDAAEARRAFFEKRAPVFRGR